MCSSVCPVGQNDCSGHLNCEIRTVGVILFITHTVLGILAISGHFSLAELTIIKTITFSSVAIISIVTLIGTDENTSKFLKICMILMAIGFMALAMVCSSELSTAKQLVDEGYILVALVPLLISCAIGKAQHAQVKEALIRQSELHKDKDQLP